MNCVERGHNVGTESFEELIDMLWNSFVYAADDSDGIKGQSPLFGTMAEAAFSVSRNLLQLRSVYWRQIKISGDNGWLFGVHILKFK